MSDDFRTTQQASTRFVRDPDRQAPPPGTRPARMGWQARLFFNNVDGMPGTDWCELGPTFFRACRLALAELERWREQGILLGSRPGG
ncbi:MAG: hypothetical protein ACOCPR_05945 [Guyparkeria sp.]